MGILKRSVYLGDILFQSGYGVPTHIAEKSAIYMDLTNANEYINKDGLVNWVLNIDADNITSYSGFTGGSGVDIYVTGGTFSAGTAVFTNNSGGTFSVSGFSSGGGGQTENFAWKFKTGTGATDPGNSFFKYNDNTNLSAVTEIYASDITNNNFDISVILSSISGSWDWYIQDSDDSTKFGLFSTQTSTYVDNGGWWTIPVTFITGSTFTTNNQVCTFLLINKNGGSVTTDVYVTGGTFTGGTSYNGGVTTFTNNTGGTFTVTGQARPSALYSESNNLSYGSSTASGIRAFAIGDGAKASNSDSISLGTQAWGVGSSCDNLISIGAFAGYNTSSSSGSTFIGNRAGLTHNGSINSIMFGTHAGSGNNYSGGSFSSIAPYSIYIGNNAGRTNATNFSGSNNIIIGNNIGVASGTTNTLNIGGVIFATGLSSTVTGYTNTSATTIGAVGINTHSPIANLDIKINTGTSYVFNIKDNDSEFFRINRSGGIFINSGATDYGAFAPTVQGMFINGNGSTAFGAGSNNRNIITFMQTFASGPISGIQAATLNYGNVRAGLYFQNNINFRPELFGNTSIAPFGNVETFRVTELGSFYIGSGNSDNSRFTVRNSRLTLGSKAISVLNSASTENVFIKDNGDSMFRGGLTANTGLLSSATQNILTVIGSGNATTSPLFSVRGSQGELFSVSDSLIGSLFSVNDISGLPVIEAFSDSTILMGNYLAPSLNTTIRIITSAGTNDIYSIPVSAYTGAFIDYTVVNGLNLRAGNIISVFYSGSTQYTETSTNDIGNTSGITFSMVISGSNAILQASGVTSGWTIKSIIRSI